MTTKNYHSKCARKQDHDMEDEPVRKSRDHIVKRCKKCKGLFYRTRNN